MTTRDDTLSGKQTGRESTAANQPPEPQAAPQARTSGWQRHGQFRVLWFNDAAA